MSPESVQPFSMIPTPAGRSETKPRTTGLTMMMDWGLPIGMQREWLELLGPFVDFAKLVVGTARVVFRCACLDCLALIHIRCQQYSAAFLPILARESRA